MKSHPLRTWLPTITFFGKNKDVIQSGSCLCAILLVSLLASCGGEQQGASNTNLTVYKSSTHNFSQDLVKNSISETVLSVSNTGTAAVQLASPTLTGDASFTLVPSQSCGSQLAAGASCPIVVQFTPKVTGTATGMLSMTEPSAGNANASTVQDRVTMVGVANALHSGSVSATANPLVASYKLSPGVDATVSVSFGTGTDYGLQTWSQATANGAVSIFVAGMRQNTTYHMRASVQLPNGNSLQDGDHTFKTTDFPSSVALPSTTVSATNGTPQPGVELVSATLAPTNNYLQAYALDLQGRIIWGYTYPGQTGAIVQPIKLLSNGHFLLIASFASQNVTGATPNSALVTLREIDLSGATIRELTLQDLNAKLAASGQNLTLTDFHHDFAILPNGHFLLITNTIKEYDNVTGFPGANQVLGDVIVDLDPNFNPVWVWNEFDHLDVNRHPEGFPDWTHTNAVLYSKDDGNILVSSRHQSWVMKVDYEDGAGSGNIIWRLGEGGDFTLANGTDPTDWFYGQHQPAFISANTTGVFTLSVMDNGYGRIFPSAVSCGSAGAPACSYSRAPVFTVDETAKTATLVYPNQQPASEFSVWGGGTTALANGNLEFDLCAEPNYNSTVQEIVPGTSSTPVWQLNISGQNAYRANRIDSLYPGVQW